MRKKRRGMNEKAQIVDPLSLASLSCQSNPETVDLLGSLLLGLILCPV